MSLGVIVAHPDDEVLGCGGTIAKSKDVHLLVLADGATGRQGWIKQDIISRRKACEAAAEILGIKSVTCLSFPDNRMDIEPVASIAKLIEDWLDQCKPDTILTHHSGDVNQDHRRTFEAVLVATRPYPGQCVKRLACFEVPSSTEWAFGSLRPFKPNAFVDVTDGWSRKLEALRCYEEEMREFPHPRSEQALTAHAAYWGSTIGVKMAEAFQVVREIWE